MCSTNLLTYLDHLDNYTRLTSQSDLFHEFACGLLSFVRTIALYMWYHSGLQSQFHGLSQKT